MSVKNFINKKNILFFIAILVLISFFVKREINSTNKAQNTNKVADVSIIKPGTSTTKNVTDKLGSPKQTKTDNNKTSYYYNSSNPNIDNEIKFEEDKVSLIKEIVKMEETDKQKLVEKYGKPTNILYGPGLNAGFVLFVYPKEGVAFVAKEDSDYTLEVWYFQPTDIDTFIKTIAPDYTKDRKDAVDGEY